MSDTGSGEVGPWTVALAKRIAEVLEGTFQGQSQAGQGSRFTPTLPSDGEIVKNVIRVVALRLLGRLSDNADPPT